MARGGLRGFHLLHGVRTGADLCFSDLMASAAAVYQPCLTGPDEAESFPAAFAGRVTQHVSERLPDGNYDFYACGRGEMIRDLAHILDERFPQARLFTESFT